MTRPALQPYLLASYQDFKGNLTTLGYDANTFLNSVQDANGNTTTFTRTPLTGKILTITHPPDAEGVASTITYSYADPATAYYLQSVTDEMQHTTVYQRDTNNRIKEIDYPDTASETFIYNGFGQVLSHKMTSGGTETFGYNGRGLKLIYRDPYHANGNPTARYQYDALDRVSGVTDARGGYPDDPNYTTNFEHNQRGQVTKVTHPNDPANPAIRYTVVIEYNDDGTVRGVTDESGHAATYAYDDYKRLQSITASPAYNGDATPRTTYFYYDKTGGTGTDYTHADANVTHLTTPLGKAVKTLYDENFWKRSVTAGTGAEAATTTLTYDAVGNLRTVQDPNGQATGAFTEYFYDKRNRLTDVNDPISTDRNTLGHTISWTYDQAGNKKSQLRANNQLVTYDQYDAMNRLQVQSVQRDTATIDQTVMAYDAAGNLITFTDGRQKQYNYRYDFLNRRIVTIYPQDDAGIRSEEAYHYNSANNLDMFNGSSRGDSGIRIRQSQPADPLLLGYLAAIHASRALANLRSSRQSYAGADGGRGYRRFGLRLEKSQDQRNPNTQRAPGANDWFYLRRRLEPENVGLSLGLPAYLQLQYAEPTAGRSRFGRASGDLYL